MAQPLDCVNTKVCPRPHIENLPMPEIIRNNRAVNNKENLWLLSAQVQII